VSAGLAPLQGVGRANLSGCARARGFTLLEVMVVVAIAGVLSALAFSVARAAARNVYLHQAAGELALRPAQLRSAALSEGRDYLLVVVDAPGNDASQCGGFNSDACTRYFVLTAPLPAWKLSAFDPGDPGVNAGYSDVEYLPRGARLYVAAEYRAPPAPFANVKIFDSRFYGKCAGGQRCFALRFAQNGAVRAELKDGGSETAPGFAFVLASDAELEGAGGDHRAIAVGFPTGVVKSWSYGR
jgi:prepilin-type N-terminal cleavage/methylation domain-containing protein